MPSARRPIRAHESELLLRLGNTSSEPETPFPPPNRGWIPTMSRPEAVFDTNPFRELLSPPIFFWLHTPTRRLRLVVLPREVCPIPTFGALPIPLCEDWERPNLHPPKQIPAPFSREHINHEMSRGSRRAVLEASPLDSESPPKPYPLCPNRVLHASEFEAGFKPISRLFGSSHPFQPLFMQPGNGVWTWGTGVRSDPQQLQVSHTFTGFSVTRTH